MNISFFRCHGDVSDRQLESLSDEQNSLNDRVLTHSDTWNLHARENYYYKLSRVIHFLACQKFSESVVASSYTKTSLKTYFARKISLQRELYDCHLDCEESQESSYQAHIKLAKSILHRRKLLTQNIVDYVNREEKLFLKKLPAWDQSKVIFAVYRDKCLYPICTHSWLKTAAIGAVVLVAAKYLFSAIPQYLNGCVSGCEPL